MWCAAAVDGNSPFLPVPIFHCSKSNYLSTAFFFVSMFNKFILTTIIVIKAKNSSSEQPFHESKHALKSHECSMHFYVL